VNERILVIEDDASASELVAYALEQNGYEVITATDGLEGLNKAQGEHAALIILDVMLPGVDGYEVCRRLRATPATATVPILMISAKARQEDKDVGLKKGADDYLTKPVKPSEILAKVETLLAGASQIVYKES